VPPTLHAPPAPTTPQNRTYFDSAEYQLQLQAQGGGSPTAANSSCSSDAGGSSTTLLQQLHSDCSSMPTDASPTNLQNWRALQALMSEASAGGFQLHADMAPVRGAAAITGTFPLPKRERRKSRLGTHPCPSIASADC
jgi:hypothetical protein